MLNFFSSQPQQETSPTNQLDFLDEPTQKKLFEFVAMQTVKTLGVEETANYASHFLQKRFEAEKPEEAFKNVNSFVVVFAQAVLKAAAYPFGTNTKGIMDLLQEFYREKVSSYTTTELETKIIAFFAKVPPSVVTLLLPAYHSFLKNSKNPETDKKIFKDIFFDRFLSPSLLKASEDEDHGMVLVTLLKALDPFRTLGKRLDDQNKVFRKITVQTETVKTAKGIYESYLETFQFNARVKQLTNIFRKFSVTFNFETKSDWGYVYVNVVTNLERLEQDDDIQTKTPQTLKALLVENKKRLVEVLKPIWPDGLLANLSHLPQLEEQIHDFRQRVYRLKVLLSDSGKLFKTDSPAKIFYDQALVDCHQLFEELATTLIRNVGTSNQEQIWEEIEKCQIKVSTVVARFINEPMDGLTPLHRLVMRSYADQKEFQADLEFLLQQGALLTPTTTNYERSGIKSTFASAFRMSKEPLNVVQLAERFGNGAALSQAEAAVEAAEEEKNQKSKDFLDSIISRSRSSSDTEGRIPAGTVLNTPILEEEQGTPSLGSKLELRIPSPDKADEPMHAPPGISLAWQRDRKRDRGQRTPETTPRDSGDSTAITQPKARRIGSGSIKS